MEASHKVYSAITKVAKALAKDGISKDRKNEAQGYKFRGIDDVYNALAPALADASLCVLPSVVEREVVERTNAKGTALFYVTVKVDFAFVSAEDGSSHHVVTYGEAMDSGDKATNKAMSAAYKYAAMQAFCIPTEGDNDADSQTHEVQPARRPQAAHPPTKPTAAQESQCMDYVAQIEGCADMAELEEAFKGAWKAIHPMGFPMMDNLLVSAKDNRKASLAEHAPAVARKAA